MKWNWQLSEWPNFKVDASKLISIEKQFFMKIGESAAYLNNLSFDDRKEFIVEILSIEGKENAKIEGELLDRESLQSSIKKHFDLKADDINSIKEKGMANLLCSIYDNFALPLSHEMLFLWHEMIFEHSKKDVEKGKYRSHDEPMQIVSGRIDNHKVFFEAPPSKQVYAEMDRFIHWFNSMKSSDSLFVRAAICHVYFESIHPFEDGNGRIGRALVEKLISKNVGKPILIAISKVLESNKKQYYAELGKCNNTLDIQPWAEFFSKSILKAQGEAMEILNFLLQKAAMLLQLFKKLNPRQEKALLRMFEEGLEGFKGGLSAENYISITKTSRATATRDLSELVNMNALVKTGELRHTRYFLNIKTLKK